MRYNSMVLLALGSLIVCAIAGCIEDEKGDDDKYKDLDMFQYTISKPIFLK